MTCPEQLLEWYVQAQVLHLQTRRAKHSPLCRGRKQCKQFKTFESKADSRLVVVAACKSRGQGGQAQMAGTEAKSTM